MPQKTHTEQKTPKIAARHLADYMAASETSKRTIIRNSKYRPIAKVIQHEAAKVAISEFLRQGSGDVARLLREAENLRESLSDDHFERTTKDLNADYIERFAKMWPQLSLPSAELLPPGTPPPLMLGGVRVTASDLRIRLRRLTRSNKVRTGGLMLRYAKGSRLDEAVAHWQSAFILGYLARTTTEDGADPEPKLCLTIDAYGGACYEAPTNSGRRFNEMTAACTSIAERWPNVAPPPNAVT